MLGTLAQTLTLVRAGFFPKRPSDLDRVDAGALPPGPFVPGPMSGAVVRSTEGYCELITGFAAECAGLDELKMMRIGGLAAAQQARLLGYEPQMVLVAVAAR